ncbi:hypothetical protein BCV70DRAFT_163006 [Testicularia cyperi]|uniref:Uncharacterized protein n=1 Tax=Testicularia cyperi TaxID=1882483 RepID=A0A317XM00_9BASI|nr:hypothetical protein BCV70DRAFT_163006 [Testicularia cyperi]
MSKAASLLHPSAAAGPASGPSSAAASTSAVTSQQALTQPSSSSTATHHHHASHGHGHSHGHSHNSHGQHHSSHSHGPVSVPTAPFVEPPALFASVAPRIYRSATPTTSSHAFLRSLNLTTILSLTAELPSASLQTFCRKQGIRFLHLGDRRWCTTLDASSDSNQYLLASSGPPISLSFLHAHRPTHATTVNYASSLTEEMIKDSLQVILDSANHPILVTDTSGIHEIGVLLGCLRKLQRWNFATILLEYRHFAGNRARATNERFIEMFDTDLVAFPDADSLPVWFKEQLDQDDREMDALDQIHYGDNGPLQ